MKVRICPQCGKQYNENAWSCADCGATLSMNTIVDITERPASKVEKKIRLCLQCGRQNDENAWNCTDCGATLSMDTVADLSDLPTSRVVMAGKGIVEGVSPFFQDDLTDLLEGTLTANDAFEIQDLPGARLKK
jgi:hypothetical protein